jgi:hypothetical protein
MMVKQNISIEILLKLFDCLDEEEEGDDDNEKSKLQAKKAKLKSAFDAEYDQSKEPDSAYLDDLKKEVEIQTKVTFLFVSLSLKSHFLVKSI